MNLLIGTFKVLYFDIFHDSVNNANVWDIFIIFEVFDFSEDTVLVMANGFVA